MSASLTFGFQTSPLRPESPAGSQPGAKAGRKPFKYKGKTKRPSRWKIRELKTHRIDSTGRARHAGGPPPKEFDPFRPLPVRRAHSSTSLTVPERSRREGTLGSVEGLAPHRISRISFSFAFPWASSLPEN